MGGQCREGIAVMSFFPLQISLAFDPLSLFFVFTILLVSVPSAIYSTGYLKHEYLPGKIKSGWALLAAFVLSMLLVVSVNNALAFLVAWEIMSLVSFFLVVFDGDDPRSVKAGVIYIVMTHIGTAFITAAFLLIYRHSQSFDYAAMKQSCLALPGAEKNVIFLCLLTGFGTKAGIVPLHVWLPYAHPQAPSHVSSIMSGVMIKTAIYGLIRFVMLILGVNSLWWGNLILVLASVSCLVGVMYALTEHDIKKLLAYHSVENIGIILLGLGASMVFTSLQAPLSAKLAMAAALYHLVNHAVFKSLLFLCAGSVYKATGLRDIEKLGGLIKAMPWTAGFFLVGAMAISALPPFNGFISEWLTLQVLFAGALNGPAGMRVLMAIYAAVLALTGGFAAACFVKAFGITFLAMPRSKNAADAHEAPVSMLAPMGFLALMCAALGLLAAPALRILSGIAGYVTGTSGSFDFSVNNFIISPQLNGAARVSGPLIAIVLAGTAAAAYLALNLVYGKRKAREYNTWDCGYYRLDARTEYTASAFSKPFRMAFSFFYRPSRRTEVKRETPYYVESMRHEISVTPIFKKYIYEIVIKRFFSTSNYISRLQSGSIHFYLAYILATLILLIVFMNRF